MPVTIPHPSHTSTEFCSPPRLDGSRSAGRWRTLASDFLEPWRHSSPTSSSPTLRWLGRHSGPDELRSRPWTGCRQVGGQGRPRRYLDASDRTRRTSESSPTGFLSERLGGDALRLAPSQVWTARLPGREAPSVPEVRRRQVDQRPDQGDCSGPLVMLTHTRGGI